MAMIDYSSNINAVGSTEAAIDAIRKNADVILTYPDYHNTSITALVSDYFGVPSQNISIGAGSTQLFFDLPRLLSYTRAVVIVPTFWEYSVLNERFNKEVQKIYLKEERQFDPDYKLIQRTIREGDAVFICNVNNPTSRLYEKEDLMRLVMDNPKTHFVIDETYLLFRADYIEQTVSSEVAVLENLHVVTSLSKFFALPGIRLGVLMSNSGTIASYVASIHVPYSIHPLSCVAFKPLLEDKEFTRKSREFYEAERKEYYEKARTKLIGRIAIVEPDGNFMFGRILTGQKSSDIVNALSARGILIRGGDELLDVGEDWIRFTIRSREDNAHFLQELDRILIRES